MSECYNDGTHVGPITEVETTKGTKMMCMYCGQYLKKRTASNAASEQGGA